MGGPSLGRNHWRTYYTVSKFRKTIKKKIFLFRSILLWRFDLLVYSRIVYLRILGNSSICINNQVNHSHGSLRIRHKCNYCLLVVPTTYLPTESATRTSRDFSTAFEKYTAVVVLQVDNFCRSIHDCYFPRSLISNTHWF